MFAPHFAGVPEKCTFQKAREANGEAGVFLEDFYEEAGFFGGHCP